MSTTREAPRRRLRRRILVAAGVVLCVLAVGLVAASFWVGLSTERACSRGQAPANNPQGGSDCFDEGSELPLGWTWDPRGNFRIR